MFMVTWLYYRIWMQYFGRLFCVKDGFQDLHPFSGNTVCELEKITISVYDAALLCMKNALFQNYFHH